MTAEAMRAVHDAALRAAPVYDADGLDASWDDDQPGLPEDLSGITMQHFQAAAEQTAPGKAKITGAAEASSPRAKPRVGTGARFSKLRAELASKGVTSPDAVAAWIGRHKYGRAKFAKIAAKAKSVKAGSRSAVALFVTERAASDGKKPYGDVTYADPGYQSDGVKRYPLDSADHCKAAWSYINMPKNAAKYSSSQLAAIKGRIRGALKRYGVATSDQSNSAEPLQIDVIRDVYLPQEWRSEGSSSALGVMSGHFSVFDTWYPVESKFEGRFLERVDRSAFDQTIQEDRDGMRVLFDHGFDPQIGNKVLGPIDTLEPDQRGAYYEVGLFDTSYNRDLLPGLRAGVYGASMRMRVHDEQWDDKPKRSTWNPEGITERTITRASVAEFGAVTFPASPGASASVRSATDRFYDQLRTRDTATYEAAVRAVSVVVPDLDGASVARSSGRIDRPGVADRNTRQRLDEGQLRLRGILK